VKRLGSLLLVAALTGGGVLAYLYTQSGGNVPKYRFAPIERGPLAAAVSSTGNLNAVITVLVGSQVSGQIKELQADFNSPVRKGQLIARIDPDIFQAKVNQARADLEASRAAVINQQAQVERARADVQNARAALAEGRAQTAKADVTVADMGRDRDRKSELFARGLIAKSDMDTAQAALDSAAAQVDSARAREQALAAGIESAAAQLRVTEAGLQASQAQVRQKEAALRQAEVDLDHTEIRAPVDGVVVSRAVDVGQTVAASLQAPTLFTIAQDLTKMQVEAAVDEADIGRIKLDDRASFTVDAFPGETFNGQVVQIRKAATVVQNVVTYTVVISVANPGGRLLPGMTANVKTVVAEKPSVLKVSNAALRYRPAGVDTGPGPAPAGPRAGPGGPPQAAGGEERRSAAGGGGRQSLESIRERLVTSLKLTAEQQTKLDPILAESRERMRGLQGLGESERRARVQEIREATRKRIREILTPEQRARYEQDAAGVPGPGGDSAGVQGRVWILGPDGKPQPLTLVLGISDGTATEVLRGDLQEGQEVIVGTTAQGGRPGQAPGGSSPPRLRL
jgi:HlyD family secretion protein